MNGRAWSPICQTAKIPRPESESEVASMAESMAPWAVMTTTGNCGWVSRYRRSTLKPSMRGIYRSRMTTS